MSDSRSCPITGVPGVAYSSLYEVSKLEYIPRALLFRYVLFPVFEFHHFLLNQLSYAVVNLETKSLMKIYYSEGTAALNARRKIEGVYRTRSNCTWSVTPGLRPFQRAGNIQVTYGMSIHCRMVKQPHPLRSPILIPTNEI